MGVVMVNSLKKLCFRIRWFTMSDKARYAYLWSLTKSGYWCAAPALR